MTVTDYRSGVFVIIPKGRSRFVMQIDAEGVLAVVGLVIERDLTAPLLALHIPEAVLPGLGAEAC